MTVVIIVASLFTDIALGALAYKVARSQDQSVRALEKIADNLDKRVSILEFRSLNQVVPGTVNVGTT